jgi:hypothetical protein
MVSALEYLTQRVLARCVTNSKTNCWEWQGPRDSRGYGHVAFPGYLATPPKYDGSFKTALVHRVMANCWDSTLVVRHLCNNPSCINTNHLKIGTQKENIADTIRSGSHRNARKTHCPEGHPYDAENTIIYADNGTHRRCRICTMNQRRERWIRHKKSSR